MMRALLLMLSASLTSCTLMLGAIASDTCREGTPPRCRNNTLILCVENVEVRVECGDSPCDAALGSCGFCGDGIFSPVDEECDDGEENSDVTPDACRTDCRLPFCGDGVTDTGEDCDDGDNNNFNGCRNNCTSN